MNKYIHLRSQESGNITISMQIERGDYCSFIKYGVSYCSPKDQFCKRTGRDLADQRMGLVPIATVKKLTHFRIQAKVLASIFVDEDYPDWAESVLEFYLSESMIAINSGW